MYRLGFAVGLTLSVFLRLVLGLGMGLLIMGAITAALNVLTLLAADNGITGPAVRAVLFTLLMCGALPFLLLGIREIDRFVKALFR